MNEWWWITCRRWASPPPESQDDTLTTACPSAQRALQRYTAWRWPRQRERENLSLFFFFSFIYSFIVSFDCDLSKPQFLLWGILNWFRAWSDIKHLLSILWRLVFPPQTYNTFKRKCFETQMVVVMKKESQNRQNYLFKKITKNQNMISIAQLLVITVYDVQTNRNR